MVLLDTDSLVAGKPNYFFGHGYMPVTTGGMF
jgi:hypothetical protein